MRQSKREFLERELESQRVWVREHGGDLAGYVLRYGSKDDPEHYGDGGEAIFAADSAHLRDLEEKVASLGPARARGAKVNALDLMLHFNEIVSEAIEAKKAVITAAYDPHGVLPIVNALGVILLDRRSRDWLRDNDPKAYGQALHAIGVEPEGLTPADVDRFVESVKPKTSRRR
jgi:hypothetical protein